MEICSARSLIFLPVNIVRLPGSYFVFLVNSAETCTDIPLEIHDNCIGLNRTTKVRIENLSDDLLLAVLPNEIRKEIYDEKVA